MESATLIKIDVPQRRSLANDLSDRLSPGYPPLPPPPTHSPPKPPSTPMEDWKVFWSTSKL